MRTIIGLAAGGIIVFFLYQILIVSGLVVDDSNATRYYETAVDNDMKVLVSDYGTWRLVGFHENQKGKNLRNIRVTIYAKGKGQKGTVEDGAPESSTTCRIGRTEGERSTKTRENAVSYNFGRIHGEGSTK